VVVVAAYLPAAWRVGVLGPFEAASAAVAARDAVRGFFGALVDGNATAALSYAAAPPADPRMLTDEVLAGSRAIAPLTDVQVLASSGSVTHQVVRALYRVGDRTVDATFDVLRLDDKWLLQSVATMADLNRLRARALGLTLNGVALPTDTPDLFIGTYTLAAPDDRFAITGSTFFVGSVRTHPDTAQISVQLSGAGVAAVREAARSRLAACLSARKLAPSGCGFRAPTPAGQPREDTITWRATGGAGELEWVQVALTIEDPTTAKGAVDITVDLTYSTIDGVVRRATSAISEVHASLRNHTTEVTFVGPD
jgi:hypothetical protein